jgi:hypothetical protein
MTVFDPSCCKGSVNNSMSVASALKFGMSDNIFEKAVPPAVPQEIWCAEAHLRYSIEFEHRSKIGRNS